MHVIMTAVVHHNYLPNLYFVLFLWRENDHLNKKF